MCGRYVITYPVKLEERFKATNSLGVLKPSYNVAPSQKVPIITRQSPNKVELMQWGLIPFWAKDPSIGFKMINARAETLLEKPTFRKPFQTQRCLVPVTGFYEWQQTNEGKTPFYIHFKNKALFALAGLYDIWHDNDNQERKSFTIITTPPNRKLQTIHNRMPAILKPEDEDKWLNKQEKTENLQALLQPFINENQLEIYPVSKRVNDPKNNNEENIKAHPEK